MKTLMVTLLLSVSATVAFAQSNADVPKDAEFQFVQVNLMPSSTYGINLVTQLESRSNFLFQTGAFLQSLKFSSPIDQFNALAPFDQRAFSPASFSRLNQSLNDAQLILNTHPSYYDR
jgi:hypothetical protein